MVAEPIPPLTEWSKKNVQKSICAQLPVRHLNNIYQHLSAPQFILKMYSINFLAVFSRDNNAKKKKKLKRDFSQLPNYIIFEYFNISVYTFSGGNSTIFPDSITQNLRLPLIFHHLSFFLCIYTFTKPYCFFLLSLCSFVFLSAKILISLSACLEKDISLLVCFLWFIQNSSLYLLPQLYFL